jgi:hypothetical protein
MGEMSSKQIVNEVNRTLYMYSLWIAFAMSLRKAYIKYRSLSVSYWAKPQSIVLGKDL